MAKKQLTIFQQELLETAKKIKEYKLACESNIAFILWKNPSLYYQYEEINLKDFSNNIWKVYWQIGKDIIIKEKKESLDDITVGLFLEKHPKLLAKYDEYGGYKTIEDGKEYVKEANINGYIQELKKWNVVMELAKLQFPVYNRLKNFADMNIDEIYNEYEAVFNKTFADVDGEEKAYDISDGIDELIDKLNEGAAVGLPLYNSEILNKEIGGLLEGYLTLIGGLSGTGKSSFVRNILLQTIIKNQEKCVIMINEEGIEKWQREFLVWISNNIFKFDLQKYTVRKGKYSEETMDILKKSANWMKENKGHIKILPFNQFNTSKTIKHLKKFAHIGVKYFVIDTFKSDSNIKNESTFWLNMQQNMVNLYDTIKPKNKNVHLICTFQLSKSSAHQRYYTQDNIGMAKNIIDVGSTCIMIRKPFEDEFENGKNQLRCLKYAGKNKKSKIPFILKRDKHYVIIFIVKNREGATNEYQIVAEHDLSRNIYKELGITSVPVDF
jgi:replicative DNA helicase